MAAGRTKMLSYSNLSDSGAQLRPIILCLAMQALVHRHHQSELVGDVAVPVSVRQAVLFCALRSPDERPRLNWRSHPNLVCDSICHIEPTQLRVKQVCQAAVVLLRAAHNSRCSVHDPLQLVGNKQLALISARQPDSQACSEHCETTDTGWRITRYACLFTPPAYTGYSFPPQQAQAE